GVCYYWEHGPCALHVCSTDSRAKSEGGWKTLVAGEPRRRAGVLSKMVVVGAAPGRDGGAAPAPAPSARGPRAISRAAGAAPSSRALVGAYFDLESDDGSSWSLGFERLSASDKLRLRDLADAFAGTASFTFEGSTATVPDAGSDGGRRRPAFV